MVTRTYIEMMKHRQQETQAETRRRVAAQEDIAAGTFRPIARFSGGVEALTAARDYAATHLLLGEDPYAIIECVVTHSRGFTRYQLRADAWEETWVRLTSRTAMQNGLLTSTPHSPVRNITSRKRFA